MGTYTRPTQQCHFEWPWVTLIDLAKYSVTRSVARSLCDSWASCFKISCSQIWWQPNEWTNERTDKMRTQCIRLPSVWPAGSIAVRHFTRVPPTHTSTVCSIIQLTWKKSKLYGSTEYWRDRVAYLCEVVDDVKFHHSGFTLQVLRPPQITLLYSHRHIIRVNDKWVNVSIITNECSTLFVFVYQGRVMALAL